MSTGRVPCEATDAKRAPGMSSGMAVCEATGGKCADSANDVPVEVPVAKIVLGRKRLFGSSEKVPAVFAPLARGHFLRFYERSFQASAIAQVLRVPASAPWRSAEEQNPHRLTLHHPPSCSATALCETPPLGHACRL
eukprot:CAMPEP_0172930150 /NCGR_PEP_ID=MMETSP1075-20121228/218846_1 /TAXON_ID=2916 /ORGANISM="Ceratium fusus, Strain PA161109" /LENGTH=136 /DNA_ID=CAMNT_0013791459 /DNA_START=341 /DNA_END=752 /DNA_ORIENTATION=+